MDKKNIQNKYKNNYIKTSADTFSKKISNLKKGEKLKLEVYGNSIKPNFSNEIYEGIEFKITYNEKGFKVKGLLQNEKDTSELVNKLIIAQNENQVISVGLKIFEIDEKTNYSNENAKYNMPQIYQKLKYTNGKDKEFGVKLDYIILGSERYNFLKRNFNDFKKKR
ncbi:MAG: hypothetical protein K9N07_07845 [Candidatus Cloacimonetes bacterium]|nr:hypothetical protein [Candidatus Cloacimonadota bacterium]MCF8012759.1 hypothetical protein [Candidatus Woesearchaeota archaeon]